VPEADETVARPVVEAGPLRATLLPEVGGRIVSLTYEGAELLWSDVEGRGGPRAPIPLPGGDKVWLAPQSEWPGGRPHPELDLGRWEWDGERMTSPWEPELGIRLARSVRPDGDALVVETVIEGEPPRPVGLWQVTQFLAPGVGRLPDLEVRPLGEGREAAATVRRAGDVTELVTDGGGPWKFGSARPCPWVEAEVGGVRVRRALAGPAGRGEVYDSDALGYWELELHSPLGERVHSERWTAQPLS
jgi:hypothetical protein